MLMKIKGVAVDFLSKRQQRALMKHSVHHTSKHIKSMVAAMKKGLSFTQSHKMASMKVGK